MSYPSYPSSFSNGIDYYTPIQSWYLLIDNLENAPETKFNIQLDTLDIPSWLATKAQTILRTLIGRNFSCVKRKKEEARVCILRMRDCIVWHLIQKFIDINEIDSVISRLMTETKNANISTTLVTNKACYHHSCTLKYNQKSYDQIVRRRRNRTTKVTN